MTRRSHNEEPCLTYKTDEEARSVGRSALSFIKDGPERTQLPAILKGLEVFAVIEVLRTHNDDLFYAEPPKLTPEQMARLHAVEKRVDDAVACNLHYFPFEYNKRAYIRLQNSHSYGHNR